MNIFKRLFKIGEAEANSALDSLENPIKMTEQGIRDMKKDLDAALKALAEVKALSIRSTREAEENKAAAEEYEKKAMVIIQNAANGKMDAAEADRVAKQALTKQEECKAQATRAQAEKQKFDTNITQLEGQIKKIKNNISKYENELKTLKARVKVSDATKNINKQLSQIDSSGTVSMLERMKEKVERDEALAEAYGEIADENKSVDDEIDSAASLGEEAQADDALAALKAKMGMNKKLEE